jgi:hypothetical protein
MVSPDKHLNKLENRMKDKAVNWTVRLCTENGLSTKAWAGKNTLETGVAISFDKDNNRPTALEFFLIAIGSELGSSLYTNLMRSGFETDCLETVVSCELQNPLVALGVIGETGFGGISVVSLTVYISTVAEEEELNKLWLKLKPRLPILSSLEKSIRVDIKFKIMI